MTRERQRVDVVVVGGGPAGTSCAIELARSGFEVLLFERRLNPRHKMCGEFLSAQGRVLLSRLGVLDDLTSAGPRAISALRMTEAGGREVDVELPEPGLGISRHALDALMMKHARLNGVTVREETSVTNLSGGLAKPPQFGFDVTTRDVDASESSWQARVVVGAWGRRSSLDRVDLTNSPWVAFKAHFAGAMPNVVELHAFDGGYCGVAPIEEGPASEQANACWIMHRERIPRADGDRFDGMLGGVLAENPKLADRLAGMRRIWDKPLSAGQLRFAPTSPFAADVCLVGDAAGMVAPLFGDGMTMALASGIRAAAEVKRFLRHDVDASGLRRQYTQAWHEAFSRRMLLGRVAHASFTAPRSARVLVGVARAAPQVLRAVLRSKAVR